MLFAVWLVTVAASAYAWVTSGWAAFLGWQGVAGALAFAVFGVSRQWPPEASVRRMAIGPLLLAGAVALGVVVWFSTGRGVI